jgi:hypothetical protein
MLLASVWRAGMIPTHFRRGQLGQALNDHLDQAILAKAFGGELEASIVALAIALKSDFISLKSTKA